VGNRFDRSLQEEFIHGGPKHTLDGLPVRRYKAQLSQSRKLPKIPKGDDNERNTMGARQELR
jgi:hypothetical protein